MGGIKGKRYHLANAMSNFFLSIPWNKFLTKDNYHNDYSFFVGMMVQTLFKIDSSYLPSVFEHLFVNISF